MLQKPSNTNFSSWGSRPQASWIGKQLVSFTHNCMSHSMLQCRLQLGNVCVQGTCSLIGTRWQKVPDCDRDSWLKRDSINNNIRDTPMFNYDVMSNTSNTVLKPKCPTTCVHEPLLTTHPQIPLLVLKWFDPMHAILETTTKPAATSIYYSLRLHLLADSTHAMAKHAQSTNCQ